MLISSRLPSQIIDILVSQYPSHTAEIDKYKKKLRPPLRLWPCIMIDLGDMIMVEDLSISVKSCEEGKSRKRERKSPITREKDRQTLINKEKERDCKYFFYCLQRRQETKKRRKKKKRQPSILKFVKYIVECRIFYFIVHALYINIDW